MQKAFVLFFIWVVAAGFIAAAPVGANVSAGTPVTLGTGAVGSVEAWGGNITAVNLQINSTTLHWQAFYGNVTAGLRLASGQSGTTYTVKAWTVSNLTGMVYVSPSSNVDFSALSSYSPTLADVDAAFPFLSGANDAATASGSNNANPLIRVGSYTIPANSRPIIQTNNGSNYPAWTQVVLNFGNLSSSSHYVFAVPINSSGNAYDNTPAHYQIMVPANATAGASTTYYFYGEIQ
jgi:hypothetical protein